MLFNLVTTPERRNSTFSSTRGMCRQDYNAVSHQFLCRSSRCYKNIPALLSDKFFIPGLVHYFEIIHKRVSHMSVSESRQATYETIAA